MISVKFNGKTYECDVRVSGRYDDDIQISDLQAWCGNTAVTDELLIEQLCEYIYENCSDTLYELWFDGQISAGEAYYDAVKHGDYN